MQPECYSLGHGDLLSRMSSGCSPFLSCCWEYVSYCIFLTHLSNSPARLVPRLYTLTSSFHSLKPDKITPFFSLHTTPCPPFPPDDPLPHDKSLSSMAFIFVSWAFYLRQFWKGTCRLKPTNEGQLCCNNFQWVGFLTVRQAATSCFTFLMALPSISPWN